MTNGFSDKCYVLPIITIIIKFLSFHLSDSGEKEVLTVIPPTILNSFIIFYLKMTQRFEDNN